MLVGRERESDMTSVYRREKEGYGNALVVREEQDGQDSWNALLCRSFVAKEPLFKGLFCGK